MQKLPKLLKLIDRFDSKIDLLETVSIRAARQINQATERIDQLRLI